MRTVHVTRDQVDAARTLIMISGGEDKVDPVFVRIAHAERPTSAGRTSTSAAR